VNDPRFDRAGVTGPQAARDPHERFLARESGKRFTENEQCDNCAASIAGVLIETVDDRGPLVAPREGWKCPVCQWWNWLERPE
jgi:uncharacterized protein with PIN domain